MLQDSASDAARGQTMFWVREAVRRGFFASPRLQLVGRAITHSNGHIYWTGGVADTARTSIDALRTKSPPRPRIST
jgi:hypothetical protein